MSKECRTRCAQCRKRTAHSYRKGKSGTDQNGRYQEIHYVCSVCGAEHTARIYPYILKDVFSLKGK